MSKVNIMFGLFCMMYVSGVFFSCGADGPGIPGTDTPPFVYNPPHETFNQADVPALSKMTLDDNGTERSYQFMPPWNYNKSHNANRDYPLVVSLHGASGSYYAPCIVNDTEEMQSYPCFVVAPHNDLWTSDTDWVFQLIEDLVSTRRIDRNRIYLMGYSMGGSGSYSFAGNYYNYTGGGLFAGIVRLAGQSQTTLPDPIADKTSIWYHIGLNDTSNNRIGIAEEAYQFIKAYDGNAGAKESITYDSVSGYARRTKTLRLDGVAFMKKSEYTNVGHSSSIPFNDPGVLLWLFNQSLINR